MADLVVIVPSRGRPENVARLGDAWREAKTFGTHLIVAVDDDDPRLGDYRAVELPYLSELWVVPRKRLGGTLNACAASVLRGLAPPLAIGFMGDDHLPRTEYWASQIVSALKETGSGIVYGNDLLQGEKLPTAAFMTSDIIRTLGWMVPPGLVHLYIDDTWRELGNAMGRLKYLPDVVIEHLHPAAGKAPRDAGYDEANSPERDRLDRAAFESWMRDGLPGDVAKLREAGLC